MEVLLESFDESISILNAQYERLQQMGDGAEDREVKIDALRALHDCFVSHTDRMSRRLDGLKTAEEREADDMEAEVARLEAELQMYTQLTEGRDAGGRRLPAPKPDCLEAYGVFATHLGDFVGRLTVLRGAVQGVMSVSRLLEADDTSHTAWFGVMNKNVWAAKEREFELAWKMLKEKAASAGVAPDDHCLVAARNLFDEVIALRKRAAARVADLQRSREARDDEVRRIETQQRRLVVWCRQQQVNLDVLSDPDHIQEFCCSLLEHYKVMSNNYRSLLESAERYLENESVQEKLLEANESWMHLQVKALERLRQTLLEVHAETVLEEHVEEYSSFGLQVEPFLEELENLLMTTENTDSSLDQQATELKEKCEALKEMLPQHDELCKKFLFFAERMRMMREAYACYRVAALSRVTYLATPAEVLAESARRKEEFECCVEELKAWADSKAKNESWRNIREKLHGIKTLLEREQEVIEQERKEMKGRVKGGISR